MSIYSDRFYFDSNEIADMSIMASNINMWFSCKNPGLFIDQSNFEGIFAKQLYFDSEIAFFTQMFKSFHKIHPFHDGNKRTLHYLYTQFISDYTNYEVTNHSSLAKAQIAYLEKYISENEFISIIIQCLRRKNMIKKNENCNLEYIVPRIDVNKGFQQGSSVNLKASLTLSDLEYKQAFYKQLRKPIFQRDTNYWAVDKVAILIDTFKTRGLIPSVILWNTLSNGTLIVDGGHRLSALISWVNDDYGKDTDYDKHLAVKEYIDTTVGSYNYLSNSDNMEMLNILSTHSLPIQWVQGDYEVVKRSFLRINEQGAELSSTEQFLIINDEEPNSLVTRAILSKMNGQNSFYENEKIQNIIDMLSRPYFSKQENYFPIHGETSHENQLLNIFELVNVFKDSDPDLIVDNLYNTIDLIVENIQLNNRVYFYNKRGSFKKASFIGIVSLINALINGNKYNLNISHFQAIREKFENYIVEHEIYIQQLVRKSRQSNNAMGDIIEYYQLLIKSFIEFDDDRLMLEYFDFLNNIKMTSKQVTEHNKYINEINNLKKCSKCGGYINSHFHQEYHAVCKY